MASPNTSGTWQPNPAGRVRGAQARASGSGSEGFQDCRQCDLLQTGVGDLEAM